ncbi:ATP-dependent sacrificial sulfur transferase LarE [Micromonospora sp. S4605]|uniref:ATP-dependent sacrificial sulfur transferase LarE n=1 Tax=Micromonospora sp. S4605 TaxID=1420897 RepID=UPI000D6F79A3|nr:ATP-dependent sacrificial sulfur transferase LarE [Micromonospora sp. S4605]PWU56755.1 ATP-dependent sacrificial sulfur transferase LarE [Micromonospora sp. S4605]
MHDPVAELAARLVAEVGRYGRPLVAFSGGVDSAVVLAAAVRALGTADVAAVTAVSPALPEAELAAARAWCAVLGVAHHAVPTAELAVRGYRDNGPRRCYFCKGTLLDTATEVAHAEGYTSLVTGTNASDVAAGFRPGIRAAAERGARTPLADLGLDKAAVRRVGRRWRVPMWDKPAAACLSSRIAYGVRITPARLARVERAEAAARALLANLGVRDLRVRDLGDSVRVEVDASLVAAARSLSVLGEAVRAAGFGDAPLTVAPFRSGSMNELLPDPKRWRRA